MTSTFLFENMSRFINAAYRGVPVNLSCKEEEEKFNYEIGQLLVCWEARQEYLESLRQSLRKKNLLFSAPKQELDTIFDLIFLNGLESLTTDQLIAIVVTPTFLENLSGELQEKLSDEPWWVDLVEAHSEI